MSDTESSIDKRTYTYDPLTGLLDRESMVVKLEHLAETRPGSFSLLIADVDELKPVNDKHGHMAGNELLKKAGDIMSSSVRVERKLTESEGRKGVPLDLDEIAAHISGDEFGIILPGIIGLVDLENVRQRIEKVLEINGIAISIDGRPHIPGETVESLLDASDQLMLRRKEARRRARFEALPKHKRVAAKFGAKLLHYAGVNPPRQ